MRRVLRSWPASRRGVDAIPREVLHEMLCGGSHPRDEVLHRMLSLLSSNAKRLGARGHKSPGSLNAQVISSGLISPQRQDL
jgi:hypothetical protein